MLQNHYDYIITGAGCAGLSLAMHMVQQKNLQQKRVLLVETAEKNQNDRTWCFWEKEPGLFESIVYKQWEKLWFYSDEFAKALSIAPYRYKMIRGIDFYQHCFTVLRQQPNVQFIQGKAERIFSDNVTGVVVDGKTISADYVFNSISFQKPALKKKDVWLLQHFKGWVIETEREAFNPREATLMDFRISQEKGTAFCYVMPFTTKKALVEYTLFTDSLLEQDEYEAALKNYIRQFLQLENYTVTETEFGVIPMTNYLFSKGEKNFINIGTAGGQTKGSSGYTFYFIQQHCKEVVAQLCAGKHPLVSTTPKRFRFYDSVLLDVLDKNRMPGKQIFSTLFRKNKPQEILSFLNNNSTPVTEARIISTLPTLPFLKAAVHQLT